MLLRAALSIIIGIWVLARVRAQRVMTVLVSIDPDIFIPAFSEISAFQRADRATKVSKQLASGFCRGVPQMRAILWTISRADVTHRPRFAHDASRLRVLGDRLGSIVWHMPISSGLVVWVCWCFYCFSDASVACRPAFCFIPLVHDGVEYAVH